MWLAPEIMKKERYTEKADVYSFGIILWELLVRVKPFDEFEEAHSQFVTVLEDAIVKGLRPNIPPDCPKAYRELIEECWHDDPKRRPDFVQICRRLDMMRDEVVSSLFD